MRARLSGVFLAVLGFLAPWRADAALDPPHDRNDANIACYYCHNLATSYGAGLSRDYSAACLGCHNEPGHKFGTPWMASDEAVPGVTGNSHSWSGPAVSPEHGSNPVFSPDVQSLLVNGNLQCAVCHDPHTTPVGYNPAKMHTSIPVGEGQVKTGTTGTGAGTAQMTLTAPKGSAAKGFRLRIQTVTAGGGSFIITHDSGWSTGGWLNWNGSAWVAGTETGAGRAYTNNADVDLDVPGVKVRWTAGAEVGDYWDFYIGYPFFRLSPSADVACNYCHKERVMNHIRARGDDRNYRPNGARKFSHPVGVGLNANGFNADRAVVLDADGTAGSSTTDGAGGVANATNDLVLQGGQVTCTTCHAAHNADSNSLSVDAR